MRTIPELLDMAKKRNGIRSDRKLAVELGLTGITPYRTKGVIPDDTTAYRLAGLCGLDPREVLLTCHILRMRQVADGKPVEQVYRGLLRIVKKSAAGIAVAAALALSTPDLAAAALPSQSPIATVKYTLCDVALRRLLAWLRRMVAQVSPFRPAFALA